MQLTERIFAGGKVYLDFLDEDKDKPDNEKPFMRYRPLTVLEMAKLKQEGYDEKGYPNLTTLCRMSVEEVGNIFSPNGEALDTIKKLLAFPNPEFVSSIAVLGGARIWNKMVLGDSEAKN
jgi:hypothetical protein